jgi:hypothetical protein
MALIRPRFPSSNSHSELSKDRITELVDAVVGEINFKANPIVETGLESEFRFRLEP